MEEDIQPARLPLSLQASARHGEDDVVFCCFFYLFYPDQLLVLRSASTHRTAQPAKIRFTNRFVSIKH